MIRYFIQLLSLGVIVQLFLLCSPAVTHADSISGYLELDYIKSDSSLRDVTGATTKTNTTSLVQRYNIALDRIIYPNLRFAAGGNFELDKDDTQTEALNISNKITTNTTKMFPFANLALNTGFASAGVGYKRRQETTETSGAPSVTLINDNYNALFGLRPEALPSVDVFFNRLNSYDDLRISQDTVNDSVLVNSRYTLIKDLNLSYQWLYNDLQDQLKNIEIQSVNQNARVTYTGQFFRDRVSFATSYNLSSQESKTVAKGPGDILNQLLPIRGYFKITNVLDDLRTVIFDPNDVTVILPPLTVREIGTDANVNIGVQTLPSGASDSRPRNLGLEFDSQQSVNVIRVLLGADDTSNLGVGNFFTNFTWRVFTSNDGRTWNELTNPPTVSFGSFPVIGQQLPRFGFELAFPTVTTRFIKVVTTPLPSFILPPPTSRIVVTSILVTKLDTFFRGPAPAGGGSTSRTIAGHYDMSSRVKLLENPNLFYDLNFTFDHVNSDQSSSTRYDVTNSLSLLHRFNDIFAGSARFSREDASDVSGRRTAYLYSASLTATPLPTLNDTLVFSGRNENISGQSDSSYSLFLNNNAELYKGLTVVLDGGLSRATSTAGIMTDDALFLFGANLVPHPMLNVNLNVTGRKEWKSGGGQPDSSTYRQDDELSVTLNPVTGIYLFGTLSILTETNKPTITTETFGGSWSPFREGNLILNISYNESVTSESSQKEKALVQSLRWYIRGSSYLDMSYVISGNSSITQNTDTNTFSTTLRITF